MWVKQVNRQKHYGEIIEILRSDNDCEIWGSDNDEDVDVNFLGCNAVWTHSRYQCFR